MPKNVTIYIVSQTHSEIAKLKSKHIWILIDILSWSCCSCNQFSNVTELMLC